MTHFFMYCPESYCTCKPTCDDICRGIECGCYMCQQAMAIHSDDLGPEPEPCEHCGRWLGHLDDCVKVGGTVDLVKARKQRVKDRVAALRSELARYEAELEPASGQRSFLEDIGPMKGTV